ncbi:MAG: hypothetical protein UX71_C0002G0016 [Parcubacteria group bacterium GW2011_GWA1_47_10]|nr:MAG: hypothetical protein UX71_C0002G0016 [Parcubacteria group bacterium GW2011_GWA1_47_10]
MAKRLSIVEHVSLAERMAQDILRATFGRDLAWHRRDYVMGDLPADGKSIRKEVQILLRTDHPEGHGFAEFFIVCEVAKPGFGLPGEWERRSVEITNPPAYAQRFVYNGCLVVKVS